MNLVAQATAKVNKPAGEVYEFISHMDNFHHWIPGLISIEESNGLQHGEAG